MGFVTRIAPSPTGHMHLGTARTAYFNYLAARASGGEFILRIDDTDKVRSKQEYTDGILAAMLWLGLEYDDAFFQSENRVWHYDYAGGMLDKGTAYKDPSGAIMVKPLDGMPRSWIDELAGEIKITDRDMDILKAGVVIVRSDRTPTYHFASCLDDADTGVNYIIRGVDHITNTAKQVMIWHALGVPIPKMAHIGLIHAGGKKLSKRDGAANVLTYRDQGVSSAALLNFLARLGWAPTEDNKANSILPKERMIEMFLTQGRMRSSAANADFTKLDWLNRKHKAMEDAKTT